MTDTASAAPSDAEIIALADETRTGEPGRDGYILPISFARAVLAKWGTPPVVAGEPVASKEASMALSNAQSKPPAESGSA